MAIIEYHVRMNLNETRNKPITFYQLRNPEDPRSIVERTFPNAETYEAYLQGREEGFEDGAQLRHHVPDGRVIFWGVPNHSPNEPSKRVKIPRTSKPVGETRRETK